MALRLFFFFLFMHFLSNAQDTLTLLSGKTIIAKKIELSGYSIGYQKMTGRGKLKYINADKVYSVKYFDGHERVIYTPDTIEPGDYSVYEMSTFIKGEQDAIKYYKNNLNKAGAFLFGAGSAFFSFYGIVGPAIYSTIVGSFAPDVQKQKVSDPSLLLINEYKEGYERKMRDKKTKSSLIYGLAGFAAGIATFSIIGHNNK